MAKRGRVSAAEAATVVKLATTSPRSRLTAPSFLSTDERVTFDLVVRNNPHLLLTSAPMLAAYAQGVARLAELKPGMAEWERLVKIVGVLSTKMRLTERSAADPKVLSRARRDRPPSPLDEFLAEEDDDDVG